MGKIADSGLVTLTALKAFLHIDFADDDTILQLILNASIAKAEGDSNNFAFAATGGVPPDDAVLWVLNHAASMWRRGASGIQHESVGGSQSVTWKEPEMWPQRYRSNPGL